MNHLKTLARGSQLKRISYTCPRIDSGIPNQNQESLKMTPEFQKWFRNQNLPSQNKYFPNVDKYRLSSWNFKNRIKMLKIDARIFKIDARIFDIDARIFKIDARIRIKFWRLVHLAAELRTPRTLGRKTNLFLSIKNCNYINGLFVFVFSSLYVVFNRIACNIYSYALLSNPLRIFFCSRIIADGFWDVFFKFKSKLRSSSPGK